MIKLAISQQNAALLGVAIIKIDIVKKVPVVHIIGKEKDDVFKGNWLACVAVFSFTNLVSSFRDQLILPELIFFAFLVVAPVHHREIRIKITEALGGQV